VRRLSHLARALTVNVWLRVAAILAAIAVALWGLDRVPQASWAPALVGLLPWVVGKYVLCPLRWHALSSSGQRRAWHLRVYAESELLGLLSPAHVAADPWRIHRLHRLGMGRGTAIAEIAQDRLVGAVGIAAFVLISGVAFPPPLLAAAGGLAVIVLAGALLLRRRRPSLFTRARLPRRGALVHGVVSSFVYQATTLVMMFGAVWAVSGPVDPIGLLAVFGASQVAAVIPGLHGVGPREGALVVGLASLGLSWTAAIGAVALTALLAWPPALLLGGSSFAARRLTQLRTT
jgi:hypothetical protein